MPVNPALKQRLVQQFQQKQQQDSLAAQASIAAAHSNEQPRSSGSKEEAAVVQLVKPSAPPPVVAVAPPPAAAEIQRPAVPALDKPKTLENRDALQKKATSAPQPASEKQQLARAPSSNTQPPLLGQKRERDQPPAKPQPPLQQQQLQKQPSLKKTKSINLLPPPAPPSSSEPTTTVTAAPIPKFKKLETVATTPIEILSSLDGQGVPRPAGHIPAPSFASYSELWTAVRRVCGDQVNRTTARLCYQDNEDDWIALLPGTPFSFFTKSVRKVLVVPLKKESTNLMK